MDERSFFSRGKPILDSGRRAAALRYEDRPVDDSIKQMQREAVLQHFLKCHRERELLKCLSLPDEKWTFERFVEQNHPDSRFIGIQHSWRILERSIGWMPGKGVAVKLEDDFKNGTLRGYQRGYNKVIFAPASGFLRINSRDARQTANGKREWARIYKTATAVWLDMTCQLSAEVQHCCSHVGKFVERFKKRVPFVLSFLAARDEFDSDDRRVAQVIEWLGWNQWRTFVLSDVWKHQSASSPYLSVVGYLKGVTEKQRVERFLLSKTKFGEYVNG